MKNHYSFKERRENTICFEVIFGNIVFLVKIVFLFIGKYYFIQTFLTKEGFIMLTNERFAACVEAQCGISLKELNSLSPRESWKRLHGNEPIKVRSFFPMIGGGGSVMHGVAKRNDRKLNSVLRNLVR